MPGLNHHAFDALLSGVLVFENGKLVHMNTVGSQLACSLGWPTTSGTPLEDFKHLAGLVIDQAVFVRREELAVRAVLRAFPGGHLIHLDDWSTQDDRLTRAEIESAKLQKVFQNAFDLVTIVSPEGDILLANGGTIDLVGYSPQEMMTMHMSAIVHPDDIPAMNAQMARLLADGGNAKVEVRVQHRDGTWRHIEAIGRNMVDDTSIGGILVSSRNIEDRRKYEKLATRMGRIFEDAFIEIYLVDPQSLTIFQTNRCARENLGYTSEELEGLTVLDLIAPASQTHAKDHIRHLVLGETDRLTTTGIHVRKDGTEYDTEIHLSLSKTEDPPVIIAFVRDITAELTVAERLRQAEKMEAIGQLAGGIAHDFNNLLTAILGGSDLLNYMIDDSEQLSLVDDISTAARRAADLTSELLAFSRRSTGQSTDVDVHEIVGEVSRLLQRSVDRRISIEVQLEAEDPYVFGDATQLQSALLNLGVNARDAMPDGGRIVFSSRTVKLSREYVAAQLGLDRAGDYLEICVQDDGSGIPERDIPRIFEPFYTTKPNGEGTGLGLAAVYGCAKFHRGQIDVFSQEGQGTLFKLLLPVSDRRPIPIDLTSEAIAGEGRILLVDDEEVVRNYASRALERLGYDVVLCKDGAEAIDTFRTHHRELALVLLDVNMPRVSGLTCFKEMRAINPNVPILLSSGFDTDSDIEALLRQGAAGFLSKPYRFEEVSQKVNMAILSRDEI